MTTPNTIRQVLIEVYGKEFPELKTMSGDDFQNRFKVSPLSNPKNVRLDQTYKMSEYLNEDHFVLIDGIFSTASLHRKRNLNNNSTMNKSNLKIRFYKKENDQGCNYSKHFQEQFVDNDKLHPKVKDVPVKVISGDYREAHVIIEDE